MHIEFDILTLFPEMVEGFLSSSMLGRGQRHGLIRAEAHQLRDWTTDKHRKTDEMPFGGGAGMVMKPEPIYAAVDRCVALSLRWSIWHQTVSRWPVNWLVSWSRKNTLYYWAVTMKEWSTRSRRFDRPRSEYWGLCADQRHLGSGSDDRLY